MKSKELKEQFVGVFDFNTGEKKSGKGIVTENGKEYFVEYDENGKEFSKKRTFEGIRLMIIGNK